ncbi:MAG TPA: hypothetical protein VFS43_38660 [Polyangiaceae bacterium]|nr:hypothetical protein [Polyangiaceae bacterium]
MALLDVDALLRDLGRTLRLERDYRAALRREPEAAAEIDPYAPARWVSTQATFRALVEREGDPAAPALAAWAFALTLGRVNRRAELAARLALAAPSVREAEPRPHLVSLREATQKLVVERAPARRKARFEAIAEAAQGDPFSAALELWARRGEAAKRLGLEAPEAPVSPTDAPLGELAARALERTDELWRELVRDAEGPAEALALGFGADESVAWPRLSGAWLRETFRGEAGWLEVPDFDPGPLPPVLAGASFLRAFARFGARWADAAASRELPLPLAHLPHGLARWGTGALVAGLWLHAPFLTRSLGWGRAEAARARRGLGLASLAAYRLSAARLLVRPAALAGARGAAREAFGEAFGRALGREVPASLALVLPRLHLSDPGRFLAFGEAARSFTRLVDAYDDDWFRNPRAIVDLRDRLGRMPERRLPADDARAGVEAAARRLTDVLA